MADPRLDVLLAEQVDFLETSAARIDAGFEHEAARIATTIRVLVHDGSGDSLSLLTQLGVLSKLQFLDTRHHPVARAGTQISTPVGWPLGMTVLELSTSGNGGYRAALGTNAEMPASRSGFAQWWKTPVLTAKDGTAWAREQFVLGPANKEGGAHVDPKPSAWWRSLRDGTWDGVGVISAPSGDVPIPRLVPAVVRQIAFELLTTIDEQVSFARVIPSAAHAGGTLLETSMEVPDPPGDSGA